MASRHRERGYLSLSSHEVIDHLCELEGAARRILPEFQALLAEVRAARDRIAPLEATAREELASAYLPALTLHAIGELERLTGFRG